MYDILERVYSDIGGLLVPTYDKYKYYITFLDRRTRFLTISLLYIKDEALAAFEEYKRRAKNNPNNKRIRELFTDNGGEYINKRFRVSLNQYGITHYTAPPYTKEPNRLIERINLILLNKVRAMLIQANLPKYL